MKWFRAAAVTAACITSLVSTGAHAQAVALQGMLGNKALLIVDGSAPKSVAPGETHLGVKVLSTAGDEAVVDIKGQRRTLRVGEAPASVGGTGASRATGAKIVLTAGNGGHFYSQGAVNGRAVYFVVDTGATTIALGASDADRLGINYKASGQQGRVGTANGVVNVWRVRLDSVRVGDVEVHGVDASILPTSMPYVLLGNSFLSRFQMTRSNDQMVLERRY
ncbi:MAG: TIGR02281 family clan AA aspartic protease [Pseudomonadota bacterium]